MATKRRTLRVPRNTVKYVNESSSDEEGEDPSVKKAKLKLKQMLEEDSDGVDPDFEKQIEPANKMEESESSSDSSPEQNMDVVIKGSFSKFESDRNKSLNLSESDSSDDEDRTKKVINTNLVKSNGIKSSGIKPSINTFGFADDIDNDGEEVASQKLMALVGNLDKLNNAWKENDSQPTLDTNLKENNSQPTNTNSKKSKPTTKKRKSTSKLKPKPKTDASEPTSSFDTSISRLLAAGEGVEGDVDSSDDEEEVKKEVVLPKEGVQVTIQLPNHIKKKKRKGFDVQAFLKREMSRARRELQILLHKSHFVCLVAHLQHLHQVVSNPVLQATALSLVPLVHIHSVHQLTLTRLSSLLSWLREAVPVNKHEGPSGIPKTNLSLSLMRGLETLLAMDDTQLVLIFILICRALNYETRIVLNFPIIPLKPPNQENLPSVAKETKPKDKSKEEIDKAIKTEEKSASKDRKSSHKNDKSKPTTSNSRNSSSSKEKNKSKIKHPVSDEEGTDSPPPPVKLSTKQKHKSSIGDKLADAVKKRAAKASLVSGCSKDTEEEILKRIDKKYPTNGNVKKESSPSSKLADAASKRASKARADDLMKGIDSKSSKSKKEVEDSSERSKEKSPKGSSSQKGKGRGNSSKAQVDTRDYWCEIWLAKESKWVAVDLLTGRINAPTEFEGKASKPMTYVLAVNNDGSLKDVTQRYASAFLTGTRKLRTEQPWVDEIMTRYPPSNKEQARKEDLALSKQADEIPLPTSVTAFKGHPLYVLQRHLLKYEAIYPPTAPTLGFLKGEAVYARECVHTLQGRTQWLKEGRVVRIGEEPYKVVKARPKWDRMTGTKVADQPLDVFGHWQTELYIPPPAKDGKVPRNEYGNVELFKPWMLPAGTVHIPINGMSRVIRKAGIDAAPAMVGWDYSGGGVHPVFDGYIVCKENAEALMDAWNQEVEAKEVRDREKKEKRVLDNWKKLVKGLMFRKKLAAKYLMKE